MTYDRRPDSAGLCPGPGLTHDQLLAENVYEFLWWSRGHLARSEATFAPRALLSLMGNLLNSVIPAEPIALTGF